MRCFLDFCAGWESRSELGEFGCAYVYVERALQDFWPPQMKAAWLTVAGRRFEEGSLGRLEVIADTYLSVNAPVQWRCPRSSSTYSFQEQLLSRVRANLKELDRLFAGQDTCSVGREEAGTQCFPLPAVQSERLASNF